MIEQFAARAMEVGARVYGPVGREDVVGELLRLYREAGARAVLCSPDLEELRGPVAETLAAAGARVIEDASLETAALADLGISRAALGVAETGSVLIAGNDLFARLATMLPLVHLLVLDRGRLVSSLDEAGSISGG